MPPFQTHEHLHAPLRAAVTDAFIHDRATTLRGLARDIGVVTDAGQPSAPLKRLVAELEADGVISVVDSSVGRTFVCWNWTGHGAEGLTLATVLDALHAAPVGDGGVPQQVELPSGRSVLLAPVSTTTRRFWHEAVRSALSTLPDAPPDMGRSLSALRDLATCVPVDRLRALGAMALLANVEGRNRNENARGCRRLLEWAAVNDIVPMWVRPPETTDEWTVWLDGVMPLPELSDPSYTTTTTLRRAAISLKKAAAERFGSAAPRTIEHLTCEQATLLIEYIGAPADGKGSNRGVNHGRRYARDAEGALRDLGYRGCGPWRELAAFTGMVRVTRTAWAPWFVLAPAVIEAGRDPGTDTEGMVALLKEHTLPAEWIEFTRWLGTYSLLTDDALRRHFDDPGFARPQTRHLVAETLTNRYRAMRTMLGLALRHRGLSPEECTLERVLGTDARDLLLDFKSEWDRLAERRASLRGRGVEPPGHDIASDSPARRHMIIQTGLLADACKTWARLREEQGQPVATGAAVALWERTYAWCKTDLRTREMAETGPVRKSVRHIQADVPSLALLPKALERVRRTVESAPRDEETRLMAQAYLIASLISTGCVRAGEVGAVKVSRNVEKFRDPKSGMVRLRFLFLPSKLRKKLRGRRAPDHAVPLVEELVPTWLFTYWLTVGRVDHIEAGGGPSHDFLFVSLDLGVPLGGAPALTAEAADDVGRHVGKAVREIFQAWRLRELELQGYTVEVGTHGHHGPHAERARALRLCRVAGVAAEASRKLLGHCSDTTAGESYDATDPEENARTIRSMMAVVSGTSGSETRPPVLITGAEARRRANGHGAAVTRALALTAAIDGLAAEAENLSPTQLMVRFTGIMGGGR